MKNIQKNEAPLIASFRACVIILNALMRSNRIVFLCNVFLPNDPWETRQNLVIYKMVSSLIYLTGSIVVGIVMMLP